MLREKRMVACSLRQLAKLLGIGVALSASLVWGFDFLGAESCQSCHPEAYSVWKASPHARAKDTLSAQQQKDARCLSCHSPNETDQRQSGVTCETCHGGGQYYTARFVMRDAELARLAGLVDPGEKSCVACHDSASPSIKPFNFAEKLKVLDHWSQDKAKRAAKP